MIHIEKNMIRCSTAKILEAKVIEYRLLMSFQNKKYNVRIIGKAPFAISQIDA